MERVCKMDIGEESDEKCCKAYFHLLRLLSHADKKMRAGNQPTFDLAKGLSLFHLVETDFSRRGYRTYLPACGAFVDSEASAACVANLLRKREEDEQPVFYAARTRQRLEKLQVAIAATTKTAHTAASRSAESG